MLLTLACGSDGSVPGGRCLELGDCPENCVDACSTAGAKKCGDGTSVLTCTQSDLGCLDWDSPQQCEEAAPFCSNGSCAASCQDDCTASGARACEGAGAKTCDYHDADSCLDWGPVVSCEGEETCSNGTCSELCTDECEADGEAQCSLGGVQSCGQYDEDACLDLSDVVPCSQGLVCSSGVCAASCSDECEQGAARCSGNGLQACGPWTDTGCLSWGTPVSCGSAATCVGDRCDTAPIALLDCPSGELQVGDTAEFDGSASFDADDTIVSWRFDFGDGAVAMGTASTVIHSYSNPGQFTVQLLVTDEWGVTNTDSCLLAVSENPCAGVVCDEPNADSCSDSVARNYASAGTCVGGSCQYAYADTFCPEGCDDDGLCRPSVCEGQTCDAPPQASCIDSSRLETHAALGGCEVDTCVYQSSEVWCSEGCFNGACINGSWQTETPGLAPPEMAYDLDMVVDALGRVHIAYCFGDVVYRTQDAYGWRETTVDQGAGGQGCQLSIALDEEGLAMIAYYEPENEDLRFARINGEDVSLQLVANSGQVGEAPSVSMTPAGDPIVGFHDRSQSLLRTATFIANSWQVQTVDSWSAAYEPMTKMLWTPAGVLYLLAGASKSARRNSGNYNQPPATLHIQDGASWQHVLIDEDAVIGRRSLQLLADNEAHVLYGREQPGTKHIRYSKVVDGFEVSDTFVRVAPNMRIRLPVGTYYTDSAPEVLVQDSLHYRLDEHGYWNYLETPVQSRGRIIDLDWNAGRLATFLHRGLRITRPWACVPLCEERTCGDDGCGGSCGLCQGTDRCDPLGGCSAWQYETTDLLGDIDVVATAGPVVFGYDEESGVRSSSWDDAGWIVSATGIDPPEKQLRYAQGSIDSDSEGELHLVAYDPRPTHYNAWDAIHLYHRVDGAWSGGEVEEFFVAASPKLKVDSTDKLHIVYADRSYPDYSGTRLVYATSEGDSYSSEVIFTPVDPYNRSNGDAKKFQLATTAQGAHILWVETIHYTSQVRLRYSTNISGSWTHDILEAPSPIRQITDTALLIDSLGTVHILYKMGNDAYYAYNSGDTWITETAPALGIFRLDDDTPTIATSGYNAIEVFSRIAVDDWERSQVPTRRSTTLLHFLIDTADRWHFFYRAGSGTSQSQNRHVFREF